MTPERVVIVIWLLWLASWIAAAFWSDPATRRPLMGEEALYRILTLSGAFLLFARFATVSRLPTETLGPRSNR